MKKQVSCFLPPPIQQKQGLWFSFIVVKRLLNPDDVCEIQIQHRVVINERQCDLNLYNINFKSVVVYLIICASEVLRAL